jgi:hypothetical protein
MEVNEQKFIYARKWNIAITKPIFTQNTLVWQLLCITLLRNFVNSERWFMIVAEAKSQSKGQKAWLTDMNKNEIL